MTVQTNTNRLTEILDNYERDLEIVMTPPRVDIAPALDNRAERRERLQRNTVQEAEPVAVALFGQFETVPFGGNRLGGEMLLTDDGDVWRELSRTRARLMEARNAAQIDAIDLNALPVAKAQAERFVEQYRQHPLLLLQALKLGEINTQARYWLEENAEVLFADIRYDIEGGKLFGWLVEQRDERYNPPAVRSARAEVDATIERCKQAVDVARRASALLGRHSDYLFYLPAAIVIDGSGGETTFERRNARATYMTAGSAARDNFLRTLGNPMVAYTEDGTKYIRA